MEQIFGIRSFATVKNGRILLNGELITETKESSFDEWMVEVYRSINLSYPKFHKMDHLSKLGFITAEFLLRDQKLTDEFEADKIGVVLSNRSSSLDTDLRYNSMLEKGVASPAVFVYTLPNILIGEMCIRNKFKGESIFFVSDKYNISQQVSYIKLMLESGVADACIGGWVELMNDSYESFLYLVTKEKSVTTNTFNEASILKLYNQI